MEEIRRCRLLHAHIKPNNVAQLYRLSFAVAAPPYSSFHYGDGFSSTVVGVDDPRRGTIVSALESPQVLPADRDPRSRDNDRETIRPFQWQLKRQWGARFVAG